MSEKQCSSHGSGSDDSNISYGDGEHLHANPGDTIGTWKLKQRVGTGQFGLVWTVEADDTKVLKIMRSGAEYAEMIESEIKILQSISCFDYIVSLSDVFVYTDTDQHHHRVMVFEKIDRDLFSLLHDREDAVPIDEGKRLIRQLLRCVGALEKEGIVHFDLKPENILVRKGPTLKICDFGTARRMPVIEVPDFGKTCEYRAPEVIMELNGCNEKSDVWSAACVAYEIITAMYKKSRCLFEPREVYLIEDIDDDDEEIDLNHLYVMQEVLGPIPKHMYRHCKEYFTVRGELRGIGKVVPCSFLDLMYEDGIGEVEAWIGFLNPMLRYNPKKRVRAIDMIDHACCS